MKRAFFAFAFISLLASSAFSKQRAEDNTFSAKVVNNSDFDITIEAKTENEQVVAAGTSAEHRFPLHTSSLYDDSWSVVWTIPLAENMTYLLEEKKSIADKQSEFVIGNPSGNDVTECYAVIQNNSNEVFNCSGAGGKTILPIYEKGAVNARTSLPIYMLAANSTAVCRLSPHDELFLSASGAKKKYIPANISYRKGYAYFILYDGVKVTLKDARPIWRVREKLWQKEFGRSVILRGVKAAGDTAYLLGTQAARDSKGNEYSEGFIARLGSRGGEEWKAPFAEKGSDTYLYDLAFDSDGSLFVAGQVVADNYEGILLNYDAGGNLKKRLSVKDAIGFDALRRSKSGALLLRGADQDGNDLEYSIGAGPSLSRTKAFSPDALAEEFVQSVTAVVYGDDGSVFMAGESARQERPTATVVQIKADGGVGVLYSAKEPNSYIMDMKINRQKGLLLVCGSLNARDSAGNGGSPFMRCVNVKSGAVEWEHVFATKKYEVAFKFAEFESYGFAVVLLNADGGGNISSPCALVRTNAVGGFDF